MGRDRFLARLHQRYAYHATLETLEKQGFEVVSEEARGEDEPVRMVLRRVV